jgi:hypothetical protein
MDEAAGKRSRTKSSPSCPDQHVVSCTEFPERQKSLVIDFCPLTTTH